MVGWAARILLIVAGTLTSWLVAKDEPIFGVVQMTIAVLLFVLLIFVLAFWPASWTVKFDGLWKRRPPS